MSLVQNNDLNSVKETPMTGFAINGRKFFTSLDLLLQI